MDDTEKDESPAILYEDEWLVAVDKPAGIIVHGDGTGAVTLTDLVAAHLEAEGVGSEALQAVQRLDRETTGVVCFSLDKDVQPKLDALVAGHGMHKRYLAVVSGDVTWECRRFDGPIARDRHDARRMRVGEGGKPAETRAVCKARTSAGTTRGGASVHSLLLVELRTGRRHQIRVHLSTDGHPIVGDVLYGGERSEDGLMLHAFEEEFDHPVTGEHLVIRAPWPHRFDRWFCEGDVVAD